MSVDPLEIAQDIEMEPGGFHRFGAARAQALQVAFCRMCLEPPHVGLAAHQLPGKFGIAREKHRLRDLQDFKSAVVEPNDFVKTLGGQRKLALGLLGG
jgi:hypothetical protein